MSKHSKDEIYASLEAVSLADFVSQLPMGLETIISEFSNDFFDWADPTSPGSKNDFGKANSYSFGRANISFK